ncbi:MAG TPA: hypothetical protein VG939_10690 [Caulobacteraceae bacterium]|nr:hypothetical protein [Caulobacteraceae bacterium]
MHRHSESAVAAVRAAPVQPAPNPAEGLWAILDPGCPKPSATNFQAWPKCASPFWISHGTAMIVRSRGDRARTMTTESYRAQYTLAAGDPVIAQVGSAKDGYMFLALTELAKDDQGRMIGAAGAAFACPGPRLGVIALRPTDNGCDTAPPDTLRAAAVETLQDHASLSRVAWIAPGAPA